MIVYDTYGMRWTFDEDRGKVYCIEAEEEILSLGGDTSENGYFCYDWEEAIELLNEYGYMDK